MQYIVYFTIYLIITSLIGWIANRPKPKLKQSQVFQMNRPYIYASLVGFDNLNPEQLKRFIKAITQMGLNFEEANKAMLKLKTAMDKVCNGK